jgi:DNA-binding transcriptional MerR regulator
MSKTQRSISSEPNEIDSCQRLPPGQRIALQKAPDSPRYSMNDLVNETGFPARTIRYYVTEGILQPAHGRGPKATYDKDHLLRLRLIDELKTEENLPLDKIRERVGRLSTSDLEAHFAIASRLIEGRWRRVIFHPDLELHIREQDEPDYAFERTVDEIINFARFKFEQLEVE